MLSGCWDRVLGQGAARVLRQGAARVLGLDTGTGCCQGAETGCCQVPWAHMGIHKKGGGKTIKNVSFYFIKEVALTT